MRNEQQAGWLRVVRASEEAPWPGPLRAFHRWVKQHPDGAMLAAAVAAVRQVYEAVSAGQAVSMQACWEAFEVAGALHDVAGVHGFGAAAGWFGEVGACLAARLEAGA